LRQAYDYWQDQPGIYPFDTRRGRSSASKRTRAAGRAPLEASRPKVIESLIKSDASRMRQRLPPLT